MVPFNDIFPARNSTKYLLEDPREPGTRLGNRAPEVVILEGGPARRPGHYRGEPGFLLERCAGPTGRKRRRSASRPLPRTGRRSPQAGRLSAAQKAPPGRPGPGRTWANGARGQGPYGSCSRVSRGELNLCPQTAPVRGRRPLPASPAALAAWGSCGANARAGCTPSCPTRADPGPAGTCFPSDAAR